MLNCEVSLGITQRTLHTFKLMMDLPRQKPEYFNFFLVETAFAPQCCVMVHSHLRFIMRELLCELFSSHNRKKWVHNPLLNFSVHAIVDQIAGVNASICNEEIVTDLFKGFPADLRSWRQNVSV